VFVICEWSSARDAHQPNRVVGFSLGAVALVTAVMIAIPYYNQHTYPDLQVNRWQAMIFLLPQALAVSVPIGITMGLAMGLAKQRMSARGYYVLLYVSRLFALSHDLAPPVALWLPNFVFTLLSAALATLSARRRAGRPSPAAS
jgi:hypothetical protein